MAAPNLATLGFKVHSEEVLTAAERLRSLPGAAAGAQQASNRLRESSEKVDAGLERVGRSAGDAGRGVVSLGDRMRGAGDAANGAGNHFRYAGGEAEYAERALANVEAQASRTGAILTRALGIVGLAIGTRELVNYADTWADLQARVNLAVSAQDDGVEVMGRITEMARRTYSGLATTAESWISMAGNLRELGMETNTTLDFVEAFNNAMVVSGARAERAEMLQRALSRAMAAGQLRGDELNTVIESGGRLAELLAQELGISTTELRKFGMEGKITGAVISSALLGNLVTLREEADSMPATIGDAFTIMNDAALRLVGSFDQLLGASETVATGIIFLADNLDRVAVYAITFATIMGGRYVAALVAARISTLGLTGALALLQTALMRLGIGIIIVGLAEIVLWFGRLSAAIGSFSEALALMGAVGKEVFERLNYLVQAASQYVIAGAATMAAGFIDAFSTIRDQAVKTYRAIVDLFSGIPLIGDKVGEWGGKGVDALEAYNKELDRTSRDLGLLSEQHAAFGDLLLARVEGPLKSLHEIREALRATGEEGEKAAESLDEVLKRIQSSAPDADTGGGKTAADRQADAIKRVVDNLKFETDQVQRSNVHQRIMNQLRQAGVELTSQQGQQIAWMVIELNRLEEAERAVQEEQERMQRQLQGIAQTGSTFFKDMVNGASSFKDVLDNVSSALGNLAKRFGDLFIDNAFQMLVGGGPSGGLLGTLFGGGRAAGGPVMAGRAYEVGERGRELFVPRVSGTIVPNHELGGGGITVNNHFNNDYRGVDPSVVTRIEASQKELVAQFDARVQLALGKQTRRRQA